MSAVWGRSGPMAADHPVLAVEVGVLQNGIAVVTGDDAPQVPQQQRGHAGHAPFCLQYKGHRRERSTRENVLRKRREYDTLRNDFETYREECGYAGHLSTFWALSWWDPPALIRRGRCGSAAWPGRCWGRHRCGRISASTAPSQTPDRATARTGLWWRDSWE